MPKEPMQLRGADDPVVVQNIDTVSDGLPCVTWLQRFRAGFCNFLQHFAMFCLGWVCEFRLFEKRIINKNMQKQAHVCQNVATCSKRLQFCKRAHAFCKSLQKFAKVGSRLFLMEVAVFRRIVRRAAGRPNSRDV